MIETVNDKYDFDNKIEMEVFSVASYGLVIRGAFFDSNLSHVQLFLIKLEISHDDID